MMDLEQLAGLAVGLVIAYFTRIADNVGGRVADDLGDHLYNRIEQRLSDDDFGRAALARVQEQPNDKRRGHALETALLETLREDEAFATALAQDVEQGRQAGLLDQTAFGHTRVTVGETSRSQFSVGPMTITNSRKLQISLGAGLIAVIAVLVLVAALMSDADGQKAQKGPSSSPMAGDADPGHGPGPEGSEPSRLDQLPTGPPIEFTDGSGFRFSFAGVHRGTAVQITPKIAAPPGATYPYVVVVVKNLQQDRTATLQEFWGITIPRDKVLAKDTATSRACDPAESPNSCVYYADCDEIDVYGTEIESAVSTIMLAPGASAWLRCHTPFGKDIKDTIKPAEIRLYSKLYFSKPPDGEILFSER